MARMSASESLHPQQFYRLHHVSENPADILKPGRVSKAWVGDLDKPCADCRGHGTKWEHDPVENEHYETGCRTCGGSGSVPDERHGVSAMRSYDDLAKYARDRHASPDANVVRFEGHEAADEDHDSHAGAVLTHPTKILSVQPFRQSTRTSRRG